MRSWQRKQGTLGKQEKTFWECGASGGETGDVWEKRKKYSGNAELVKTGDIQNNREKAFWKCRAGGGNWGCLRMLVLWFSRHPQFPPTFPLVSSTSSAFPECFFSVILDIPSFHQFRILRIYIFLFPDIPSFPSTGFTFPECFLLFSQTSPVSSASSAFSECFFSVSLDISSFHQFRISRIFFPLFPRHSQFPPLAPHFQNAFSLFSELQVEEPSDGDVRESVNNVSQGHTGMQNSGKQRNEHRNSLERCCFALNLKAMARMRTGEVETYLLRVRVDTFKCIESILC